MKRNYTALFTIVFTFFLVVKGFLPANATHISGTDISYVNVGPNVYVIKFKTYSLCNNLASSPTETLTYRAPGCSNSVSNLTLQLQSTQATSQYCAASNNCAASDNLPLDLTTERIYTGTLSFTSMCPNWVLSNRNQGRSTARNLALGSQEWIYTTATINNIFTVTNNSPVWGVLPGFVFGVDQQVNFSYSITDPDGDSLVHYLVPSLNDASVPVSYSTYPAGTSPAGTAYSAGQFSGTNPLITQGSVTVDRQSGAISMKPIAYISPANPFFKVQNIYTLAYEVEEYRKVNNVMRKIGSIRRDVQVGIGDFGVNKLPVIHSILYKGTNYPNKSIIRIRPGQNATINFSSSKAAGNNVVLMTSNNLVAVPGSSFTVNSALQQEGTLSWTPTAAQVRSYPYYVTVTVTDENCPVRAYQVYTIGLVVDPNASIASVPDNFSKSVFSAYPNPTNNSETTFKFTRAAKNAEILICNIGGKVVDRIFVKAGEEQVRWNKKADLPAGVYFARFTTEAGSQTIKLIHLK